MEINKERAKLRVNNYITVASQENGEALLVL